MSHARSLSLLIALFAVCSTCSAQHNDRVHEVGEKALVVIRDSGSDFSRPRLLSRAALLTARNHEEESAHELFEEALSNVPDNDEKGQLGEIASNQAAAGFCESAFETIERMNKIRQQPAVNDWTLTAVVRITAQRLNFQVAHVACDKITYSYCRSVALAHLAVAHFKQGEKEIAQTLLAEAVAECRKAGGEDGTIFHVGVVIGIISREGMQESAREVIANEIPHAKGKVDWQSIMEMEAECGDVAGVQRAAEEFKKVLDDKREEERIKWNLAKAQAKSGMLDEALQTTMSVRDVQLYLPGASQVVNSFINAGRLDDALNLIESMPGKGRGGVEYPESLLNIAEAHFKNGDVAQAKDLMRKARDYLKLKDPNASEYEFALVGEVHGKLGLEDEIMAWAESLEIPDAKASALIGLANGILYREQAK